jgi:hypothetical protein
MNFETPPRARRAEYAFVDVMDVKLFIDVHQKVQPLTETVTIRNRTLWAAVLDFLAEQDSVTRERLFERFRQDSEDVAAVLNALVSHGIVDCAGRGTSTSYGLSPASDSSSCSRSSW